MRADDVERAVQEFLVIFGGGRCLVSISSNAITIILKQDLVWTVAQ
jgi:hypothetical protein